MKTGFGLPANSRNIGTHRKGSININLFQDNVLFLFLLKTSENQRVAATNLLIMPNNINLKIYNI